MAAPVVSVTVEDLDEMLADGTYDRCTGRVTVRVFGVVPVRFRRCRRKAVALITVTCSRDGTYTRGICGEHLRLLRANPDAVVCNDCGEQASWSVGGG